MILDYLRVLLTWPVIGGGLFAFALVIFKEQIRSLINRIGRIKFPGGEFSTSQVQKSEEAVQQGPVTPPTPPAPPPIEGVHLSPGDLEQVRAYLQAEHAAARIWEYRFLNYFLADSTQAVLDWLLALNQPTTVSAFEAVWMHTIQNAAERTAILHALQLHVLISMDGQTIILTEKGREYATWPERRRLRTA